MSSVTRENMNALANDCFHSVLREIYKCAQRGQFCTYISEEQEKAIRGMLERRGFFLTPSKDAYGRANGWKVSWYAEND